MPDSRFEPAYERAAQASRAPGPKLSTIARDELVAALSVAYSRDARLANAIATELLNRLRRAPYLGAAIAMCAALVATLATNWLDAGAFLLWESGPRAEILDVLSLLLLLGASLSFAIYRGRFSGLRLRIASGRRPW